MAGALVAVLVATALVAVRIGNRGSGVAAIAANSLGLIQATSNELVGQLPLEARSGQVATGEGAVWVASEEGTVSRVDAATRQVVQRITVGRDPVGVAAGHGAVWVASSGDRSVSWINPSTNTVVKTVPVGNGPTGIALGDGAVWVANSLDNSVSRIDADTGRVVATIGVGGTPSGVAAGLGAVWVSNTTDGTVSRISPSSNTVVRPIPVGNGPRAIAVGADAVWVANGLDGTVSRIDPASDTVVATVGVGDGPSAVAVSPGAVWAASEVRGTVTRLDPDTNRVVRTIDIGSAPAGAAAVGDGLWVTTRGAPSSHRGGILKLIAVKSFGIASLDPALWNEGESNHVQGQFLVMTNDGLVGFKRVGGLDGSTLVANLATAVPRPTDGGTTYTFRLRPGIRFSTGQVVTPEDVRWSIERGFKLRSTWHRRVPPGCRRRRGLQPPPGDLPALQRDRHRPVGQHRHLPSHPARPGLPGQPGPADGVRGPRRDTGQGRRDQPRPGHRPLHGPSVRPQPEAHAGAQPRLPRMVPRRATRRLSRHDRLEPLGRPLPGRRGRGGRRRPARAGRPLRRPATQRPDRGAHHQVHQPDPPVALHWHLRDVPQHPRAAL